ncbi:hypothetical protein TrVFT333_002390 [Trichoderma virens FT-333]|nr:hypothetical protein TrVFT333_002390 [Trichoderma virens FT-333]
MPHSKVPTTASSHTIHGVQLHVNDGLLAPTDVCEMRISYPTEPINELYRRYKDDGYVLLKGLLPRQDVFAAREAYFASLASTGILQPGTAAVDGIFNSSASTSDYPGIGASSLDVKTDTNNPAGRFVEAAVKTHTEPWYNGSEKDGIAGFCNHPILRDFVANIVGWGKDILTVRRTLLRNNTPGNRAIGVHYDQIFMRYGEPTAVTAWVPIGDVRIEGGGLIYLEGGDQVGREMEEEFSRKAKAAGMSDQETRNAFNANMTSTGFLSESPREFARDRGRKWLVSAYEAGDVVLHTPHMIHASTINHDPEGRIRLGTDLRFVNSKRPWDKRWDKDFALGDGL